MAFQDNILRFLQGMNTFGIPQQEPNLGNSVGLPPGTMNINSSSDPVFTPHTEAQDRLKVALDQMPTRNTPGVWRKIGASIAGLGGPQSADNFMYGGYYRDMDDWKNKVEPLGDLARIENQENTQNRIALNDLNRYNYQTETNKIRQDAEERRTKEGEAKIETATKNAETARIRAEAYRDAQKGGVLYKDELNGKAYMVYKDGTVKQLPVDALSKEDELDFINAGKMQVMRADQQFDERMIRLRAALESGQIAQRAAEQRTTDAAKPSATASQTMSPTEVNKDRQNRLDEWIRNNPDKQKWIKTNPNTDTIYIEPPAGWFTDATPEDVKKAKEATDWIDKGVRPRSMGAGVVTKPTPARTSGAGTNSEAPPKGAKAGGKWINTKYGRVYQEP